MNPLEVVARRLRAQRITGRGHGSVLEAVAWSGAVQAQEPRESRWSLGMRVPGTDDRAVQAAIDSGEIVRVHALRPTWHYVAAADIAWIQRLTAQRVHRRSARYYADSGLDGPALARVHATLSRVLADGPVDRRSIAAALGLRGVPLAMALMHAELELLVVSGPRQSYRLAAGLVPPAPDRSRDEDMTELARRYAQSHALATPEDFAWWSGLTVADARASLERAAVEPDPAPPPPPPPVLLMPTFDETAVAHRRRRYATADGSTDELLVRPLLAGGVVAGTWRRGRRGIEVAAAADEEEVRAEVARMDAFTT